MSGPSLPSGEAEALFAALRAHEKGDGGPMARWDRETRAKWLRVLRRWAPRWVNEEDILQDVVRVACKAVLEGQAVRSPGGWLSRVALRRVQKLMRRREEEEEEKKKKKKKEKARIEEVPDAAPGPFQVAAATDETNHEREKVMEVARILPQPYGHVLVWKLIEGLSWQKIRDRLNAHRPARMPAVGDRAAQAFIAKGVLMLEAWLRGVDPRLAHRQKYVPKKNRWIDSLLPPIGH